jgi:predicted transcriptional regulator
LNLIEHNRRRVPPDVLTRLAAALSDTPDAFADGGGALALDDLRAVALAWPDAEIGRAEEFAQRFPGWAEVVLAMHQRALAQEAAIAAVNDRMSHDPHLSASLHDVLSAVASVRATTEILVENEQLEPEWQTRFLRNLDQDSARLAKGAEELVRYLETGGQIEAQGTAAPQEEVEAWALAQNWQIAHAELAATMSAPAREMARALQDDLRADLAALPDAAYQQALARHGPDPLAIAQSCGAPPFSAFRRLAFDPSLGAGLVMCDGSGTLVLRRPVTGFSLPRFGAACPLWPLFSALARPMQPIETYAEFGATGPAAPRFLLRAFGQTQHPAGFAGPELRAAMMLILPQSAMGAAAPVLGLGATCRTCPRAPCPARREPSILASATSL